MRTGEGGLDPPGHRHGRADLALHWTLRERIVMGVRKQSVSFTDAAFAYAKELVDRGN